MPTRFPRLPYRSYKSRRPSALTVDDRIHQHFGFPLTYSEVKDHVRSTYRCDADQVFNETAHLAALNGIDHNYTGCQGVSFTQPTTCPCGYFSVLKFINDNPNVSKHEIDLHFGAKLINTVQRLVAGGLIKLERLRSKLTNRTCAHYSTSDLGRAFVIVGSNYLVKRGPGPFKRKHL